jgi:hypothetical protein
LEKTRQRASVRTNFAREVLRAERAMNQVIRDPELGRNVKNL